MLLLNWAKNLNRVVGRGGGGGRYTFLKKRNPGIFKSLNLSLYVKIFHSFTSENSSKLCGTTWPWLGKYKVKNQVLSISFLCSSFFINLYFRFLGHCNFSHKNGHFLYGIINLSSK